METGTMLKSLRDPMGIPFYPIVFQVLMVLTFALHILFINFTLGTSFVAVYGHFRGGENWKRLSRATAKAANVNISTAMLLGIAPLLFVQVIYEPFWYASNALSAAWVIGFILIMMAAYSALYVFSLRREKTAGKGHTFFGLAAFALFLLAGVIMHALGYQLLQPEKWYGWYVKGNAVDASGLSLHAFQLPRFLHFVVPSFAITGIFMRLYAWYFSNRRDMDKGYLEWVGRTGGAMAFGFTALQAVVGFWWLLSVPGELAFMTNPFFLIGAAMGICLLALLYVAQKDPLKYAIPSGLGAFLTIFGMSYAREALRMQYLHRFSYFVFQHKLNIDWGSTLLFLATFVMGLVVISYLISIAYKSGRVEGRYEASSSMHGLGRVSVALLLAWIVVVAGLGVVITVKNYFM